MFTIYRLQSSVKHLGLTLCAALFATSAAFAANTIDLSTVEPDAENVIHVKNNDILTGELDGQNRPYKVLIDESAGTEPTTVTLDGVNIKGTNNKACPWAGITCEGDCNIVLAEGSENKVKGFYSGYPGIHIPEDKTLTISGEGELDASSNAFGAGIGGGDNISFGNIVIEGGVINAMGGSTAAGIGTGSSDGTLTMGSITINGGTVIATGGNYAAGIGTGNNHSEELTVGTITINGGTVNATGGEYAAGIGAGYNWGTLTVGAITINGGTVNATGGKYASGIGTGSNNWGTLTVGAITITNGVTKVVATKGSDALHSVGIGYNENGAQATITSITIGGETVDPIADEKYIFTTITYDITFDANGGSGTMQKQELVPGKKLNANAFTHKELLFAGWNTKKDGSGLAFKDEAIAPDFGEEGSSVTLYAQWFDGDLSKLNGDYTAHDGNTLTGTLGGNYKISIADGATVTLDGVTINGTNDEAYPWAGITCEGDCNIVLAKDSENKVKGFYSSNPGIHVPEGKTLTISGEGKLDASSNGYGAGIGGARNISSGNIVIDGGVINATGSVCAAGIGTGYNNGTLTMGTITINGGTINATGGNNAAGIGTGYNSGTLTAGAITINGGTINATGGDDAAGIGAGYNWYELTIGAITINGGTINATGGKYASGIGTGYNDGTLTMGAITITNGVTKVIATKGSDALHSVGIGYNENGAQATITSITIGGETIDQENNPITDKTYVFPVITYDITFDANGGSGTMQKQELVPGKKLNANAFTHKELLFAGWNTKKDGSGLAFKDEAIAPDFGEEGSSVTLYAQWFDGDLSKLNGDYTAHDGNTLTGTLGGNYKISIADGATVTLDGVTINGTDDEAYPWAGITCEGDCNIVLAKDSENKVKGFYSSNPGIHVPEGKTLTISGEGKLDASSSGYGAGIGGGDNISSGNIVIEGGVINAMGGEGASGIGTGSNNGTLTMGTITINGGTVIATGGEGASGIGAGFNWDELTIGAITINGGTVNATGGECAAGIGAGFNWAELTTGAITINGGTVNATGGEYASGIGTGYNDGILTMGAITITNGVTKVIATKGSDALHSVGIGYNTDVNGSQTTITSITIGGETIDQENNPITDKTYVFIPEILVIEETSGQKHALINGIYSGESALNIDKDTDVDTVTIKRTFAKITNKDNNGNPLPNYFTIVFPFDVEGKNLEGIEIVAKFRGVVKNKTTGIKEVKAERTWCDEVANENCHYETATLTAYTPYLVQLKDGATSIGVKGAVTLKKTPEDPSALDVAATESDGSGEYVFRAMLQGKTWQKTDPEITGENKAAAYGYSANDVKDVASAGEFVKVGAGSYIMPLRAYIYKKPEPSSIRSNASYAIRHDELSNDDIPDRMNVVIVDSDDSGNERTTVIGQFKARTGEFRWTTSTFDLKGRNVGNGKKARGAYYGKRILKK